MKGVTFPGDRRVLVLKFPDPVPGDGEVVVRVKASAICRSDMSLYYGNPVLQGGKPGEFISGHEAAGIVESVGPGVKEIKPGRRVAVHLAIGCGHCPYCRTGHYHLCKEFDCIGFTCNGGNAEFLVVPERNCMPIPDDISYAVAAVSTDAFGTLYNAANRLDLSGIDTVAIFGLGPMGAAGVLAAKARGARVIGVDLMAERRALALELGADGTVDSGAGDPVARLLELTGGRGVDAAIDCSGNGTAQNAALDAVRPFGRVAFIGESKETTIRTSDQLIRKQITLMGCWYFSAADYPAIMRCITEKKVPIEKLITHTFSLDEAEKAFRMFDARETEKAVFLM